MHRLHCGSVSHGQRACPCDFLLGLTRVSDQNFAFVVVRAIYMHIRTMENEPEMDADQGVETDPHAVMNVKNFYLVGKLASELPNEDTQPSAALYRAVCEGDVCATKLLLESEHYPNLPYYFPGSGRILDDFLYYIVGRNIEDRWGMFLYPLHRAVLLNNVELVGLLLEYGSDPNALDGRSNSPLAMLVKSPIHAFDVHEYENAWVFPKHGRKECHVARVLLHHGADINGVLSRYDGSFMDLFEMCCWSGDRETAHEVLGGLLDAGCDSHLCYKILEDIVENTDFGIFGDTSAVCALTILIQIGFDVDHILSRCTPMQSLFLDFDVKLKRMNETRWHCPKCREFKSVCLSRYLSRAWPLVKAGAQVKWTEGEDIIGKLVPSSL